MSLPLACCNCTLALPLWSCRCVDSTCRNKLLGGAFMHMTMRNEASQVRVKGGGGGGRHYGSQPEAGAMGTQVSGPRFVAEAVEGLLS